MNFMSKSLCRFITFALTFALVFSGVPCDSSEKAEAANVTGIVLADENDPSSTASAPAVSESPSAEPTLNPNAKEFYVTNSDLFTIDDEGYITSFDGSRFAYNDEDVVIPSKINNIEVKGIGAGAFANDEKLTGIVVPSKIASIGAVCFDNCSSLVRMNTYSDEDITVGADGFDKVVINDFRTDEIVIPESLTQINSSAFKGTKSVKKFFVSDKNPAFKTSEDQVLLLSKDGKNLIRYASAHHESYLYTLPEGLENIMDYGCENAMDVQGFVVPASVKTIGAYGFYDGGNLMWVYFNELNGEPQVSKIGGYAFASNDNLSVSLPSSVTEIGEYCFAYCSNLRETCDVSAYTNPATTAGILARTNITVVPAYCFYGCPNLHWVDLPATVQVIEEYAFSGCVNMDTVNFAGDTLSTIGEGAFEGNANLHSIDIPEGVTTIPESAFSGCQNLNTVHLPESLTTIEDNAFSDCNNIHEMNIPSAVTEISDTAFANVTNYDGIDTTQNEYADTLLGKYSVKATPAAVVATTRPAVATATPAATTLPATPAAKGTVFKSGKYKYKVVSANASRAGVMIMGFKNAKLKKKSTAVVIPAKVKYNNFSNYVVQSVKANAFGGCKKVKKAVIGKQIKTIGAKAFFKCKALRSVTVKSTKVKKVGARAFAGVHKRAYLRTGKKMFKKYKKIFKGKGIKRIRK